MKLLIYKIAILIIFLSVCLTDTVAQITNPILRLNTKMHTSRIRRISTDAAGKYLLTVSEDKTAKLWNAATGELIRTFRPPIGQGDEGKLYAGAISPDGKTIVVGGTSDYIYFFNTTSGKLIQSICIITEGSLLDLEFSADEKYLAAACGEKRGIVVIRKGNSGFNYFKTLDGYGSFVPSLAFDKNGRLATVCNDGKIRLYDKAFRLISKITGTGKEPYSIAFSPDCSKIAVGYHDVADLDVRSGSDLQLIYRPKLGGVTVKGAFHSGLCFSSNGQYLYGGGYYRQKQTNGIEWNMIRRWSNEGAGNYQDIPVCQNSVSDLKALPEGDMLYCGLEPDLGRINKSGYKSYYQEGEINHYFSYDSTYLKINETGDRLAVTTSQRQVVQFSTSSRNLVLSGDFPNGSVSTDQKTGIRVTDLFDSPKINGSATSFLGKSERCTCVDIAPDASGIVFGTDWNLYYTDTAGKTIWDTSIPGLANVVNISENGQCVVAAFSDGTIRWYKKSKDRGVIISYIVPGGAAKKAGLKMGDQIISVNGVVLNSPKEAAEYFNRFERKSILKVKRGGEILNIRIVLLNDADFFGIGYESPSNELLSLYIYPDNKRWILWTPEGYFDCSKGAEDLIGWHVNNGQDKEASFYPASRFFDNYYRPDIIQEIFKNYETGEQIAARLGGTKNTLANFKRPPLVNILSPTNGANATASTATITVEATDQGGGIDEMLLYHNSKLIQTTQRGFKPAQVANEKRTQTYTVELVPGENTFTASAFNTDRTESNPYSIKVNYAGAQRNTTLHLFVVGINKYKNATYNLNYAQADAQAVKQKIYEAGSGIFKDIKLYELYDENATRTGIEAVIEKIKATSAPNDLFLFFYAGHGVMSDPEGGEQPKFFLVPYDVIKMYGNNTMLNNLGISALELRDWCKNIKAQKQVILLDACQSGGAVETFAMRGAAEEKAVLQLGRSAGVVVMASTGTQQFATEFKQLGHGVFTYSLLEGLNGKADGGFKDKKVTIKELETFINDYIPELSKQYRGEAQYPNSYGTGMDFPIGVVK